MNRIIQRMVTLNNSKRVAIRLDTYTWQAVEWLANKSNQKWNKFIASILDNVSDDESNRTSFLREEVMRQILAEQMIALEENKKMPIKGELLSELKGLLKK